MEKMDINIGGHASRIMKSLLGKKMYCAGDIELGRIIDFCGKEIIISEFYGFKHQDEYAQCYTDAKGETWFISVRCPSCGHDHPLWIVLRRVF